jgi:chromosome segregation ATPase
MGVYEDMASDAGYPFGSDENAQMAAAIEQQHMEQVLAHDEQDAFLSELGDAGPLVQQEIANQAEEIKRLHRRIAELEADLGDVIRDRDKAERQLVHKHERVKGLEAKLARVREWADSLPKQPLVTIYRNTVLDILYDTNNEESEGEHE